MLTFTKYGSCVTRDVFNFLHINNWYPLYTYTGINIANMLPKSNLQILDEDICAGSNFEIQMLKYSFSHEAFEKYIKTIKSDYFIFDLADERLPLQKWEYNGEVSEVPVTWNTYRTSKKVKENTQYLNGGVKISDWHLANRNMALYENQIEEFCNILKENFSEDHIIYLSLRQAKEFLNADIEAICNFDDFEEKGIERKALRDKQDMVIGDAEKILYKQLPNIWKIDMPENAIADDRHHFGRHTLHFHYILYEYFAECISLIANDTRMFDKLRRKIEQGIKIRQKYAEIRFDELRRLYL